MSGILSILVGTDTAVTVNGTTYTVSLSDNATNITLSIEPEDAAATVTVVDSTSATVDTSSDGTITTGDITLAANVNPAFTITVTAADSTTTDYTLVITNPPAMPAITCNVLTDIAATTLTVHWNNTVRNNNVKYRAWCFPATSLSGDDTTNITAAGPTYAHYDAALSSSAASSTIIIGSSPDSPLTAGISYAVYVRAYYVDTGVTSIFRQLLRTPTATPYAAISTIKMAGISATTTNGSAYSVTLPSNISSGTLLIVLADSRATYTVNGAALSNPISLVRGENNFTIVVTAFDNRYSATYSLTINNPLPPSPPITQVVATFVNGTTGSVIPVVATTIPDGPAIGDWAAIVPAGTWDTINLKVMTSDNSVPSGWTYSSSTQSSGKSLLQSPPDSMDISFPSGLSTKLYFPIGLQVSLVASGETFTASTTDGFTYVVTLTSRQTSGTLNISAPSNQSAAITVNGSGGDGPYSGSVSLSPNENNVTVQVYVQSAMNYYISISNPPIAPTVTVGAITDHTIALSWNDVSVGTGTPPLAVKYEVWCILNQYVLATATATVEAARINNSKIGYYNLEAEGQSITMTGLVAGTQYTTYVRAYYTSTNFIGAYSGGDDRSTTGTAPSPDSSMQSVTVNGAAAPYAVSTFGSILSTNRATVGVVLQATNTKARISFNGTTSTTNSLTVPSLSLVSGLNTITITVTAEDSSTGSYILSITNPEPDPVGCFLGHMPVLTPTGYSRIDSLKVGDLVITETGAAVPIKTVRVRRMRPTKINNPYVIPKGQHGATQDVLISPDHSVIVAGEFIKASKLGLAQRPMKNPFNYYNLELPEWANMRVAGVEVESLAPTNQYIVSMDEMKKIAFNLLKKGVPMKKLERLIGLMGNEKAVIFCPQ
jgi:hypothetical protein